MLASKYDFLFQSLLLFVIGLLIACGGDSDKNRYPRQKPAAETFLGDWVLRANTGSQGTPVAGGTTNQLVASFVFNGDGSFKAQDLPGRAVAKFSSGKTTIDGKGIWSLRRHQNFWVLRIEWNDIAGSQVDYGAMLHIVETQPTITLKYIIGDPDAGDALIFTKKPK